MLKSRTQQIIEAEHGGKDFKDILLEALDRRRGQSNIAYKTATDLGVSHQAIYVWCRNLGISLDDYRN